MNYIERVLQKTIINNLQPNKILVLIGARRTGKTVLLKKNSSHLKEPFIFLNGEDFTVSELLQRRSVQHYKNFIGDRKILIIDEAQKIENIGQILKLMIDEIDGLKVIITGSSAFDISNKTGEPLTGRKITHHIFPISEMEFNKYEDFTQKPDNLRHRLVFGSYPELVHLKNNSKKSKYLQEIVNSYLLKDILTFENLRNSSKIFNLLRLIAYQVGSEVSFQELAGKLSISKNTVEKYLNLLTKVFVLHKLEGFSRNLRKEITKTSKWYFYDNGIRNALIGNLNPIELRNDVGVLWENYVISERIKYQNYNNILVNNYFWRTYDQQEIDWVEERNGKLYGYEMKWKEQKAKKPASWAKAYPNAEFKIISSENYFKWIV